MKLHVGKKSSRRSHVAPLLLILRGNLNIFNVPAPLGYTLVKQSPPYVLGHVRANHLTKHLAIALRNKVNQAHETSHPSRNVRHPISDGRHSICPRGATLCEQSVP
ncbi:hypothetical protein Bpfe_030096 [Biomphalaria pfeifferi]|uniref:Uncharacterized protein n=1 Tax=Biomphalaria pfeifferi TaxID=112525 RepID=A0AAD8ARF0_BIOPF|nr:hypothetical protein Bpfe_030096 [Biomphalaria pfeifferi]